MTTEIEVKSRDYWFKIVEFLQQTSVWSISTQLPELFPDRAETTEGARAALPHNRGPGPENTTNEAVLVRARAEICSKPCTALTSIRTRVCSHRRKAAAVSWLTKNSPRPRPKQT
jgi:hypothetical protein